MTYLYSLCNKYFNYHVHLSTIMQIQCIFLLFTRQLPRASTGSWEWMEGIATQTTRQKLIYSNNYDYVNYVNWKEHGLCLIEMGCFCFTSYSKMFQPYLWQHIVVQVWLKKKLDIWSVSHAIGILQGFYCAHQKHRHRVTLFPLILRNRTPLSRSEIQHVIESSLKKNIWYLRSCIPPLLGIVFPSQLHRCSIAVMFDLWSEGRLFETRCPRAISGRTSNGKEVKRRIRASTLVSG